MVNPPVGQTCPVCNTNNRPQAQFCSRCGAPLELQNKYRIVRLLGRGGYSAVYEAEHLRLGNARYAIKELFPESHLTPTERQAASAQFNTEASILANLSYPMLPKVSDFFTERGRDYLVMEFVPGDTLEEYLAKSNTPVPETQVLKWADELCNALIYLHSQNPPVIHRDIKPGNIKITPDGQIKLLDFGISKLLNVGAKTGTSARAGTPPYTPLEQYGTGTDERSDIYALGVVLYEMLTKQKPPEAPDRSRIATIPPRQLNPEISATTEALVLKAMAEAQSDRFQSAEEMQKAIQNPQAVAPLAPSAQANVQVVPISSNSASPIPFPLWTIPVALLLIVGLAFLAYNMGETIIRTDVTATAQAEKTQVAFVSQVTGTAQAQDTATMQAKLVATRNAQVTATSSAGRTLAAQSNTNATSAAIGTATALEAATETANAATTDEANRRATDISISVQQTVAVNQATSMADAASTLQAFQATDEANSSATLADFQSTLAAQATANAAATNDAGIFRKTLNVRADVGWQNTGINILQGQKVRVTYLNGTWCVFPNGCGPPNNGGGSGGLVENLELISVIGQIGNDPVPFAIGQSRSFTADSSGLLYLRVNDRDIRDNSGSIVMQVEVQLP